MGMPPKVPTRVVDHEANVKKLHDLILKETEQHSNKENLERNNSLSKLNAPEPEVIRKQRPDSGRGERDVLIKVKDAKTEKMLH